MPNRSTKDERDTDPEGYSQGPTRHVAGPASDSDRKAALASRSSEREVDSRPAPAHAYKPDPLNPANDENPTKDLTIGTAARRLRGSKQKMDDEIDYASK